MRVIRVWYYEEDYWFEINRLLYLEAGTEKYRQGMFWQHFLCACFFVCFFRLTCVILLRKYQSKSEITLWNSAKARISLRKKTPITTILLPRDELWYEEKPGNAKLRWKREAVCPTAGGSRISSNRTFAALFPYIYNRSTKEECQMRKRKLKIFLTPTENSIVIQSLNHLRNALLRENRDTGCLDELLLKVMCAPVKKM